MNKKEIIKNIENKNLIVGVVGLGYVGLPLAVEKAMAGFKTIGFDIQDEKVKSVNEGHNYIGDVVDDELKDLVEKGMLRATTDFSEVARADFVAICVPTPLDAYRQPDISYVRDSAISISKYLKKGAIVVLESTTYPGTTEEFLKPILEAGSGLVCGKDFYLAFSPERVDPGNKEYKTKNTPKVVGGIGKDATEVAAAMYRSVLSSDVKEVSSPAVAEMEKILENTYRNINIGLINEMAILCHRMGIDIWEVVDAAKTKPYGFQAFYPGPGLGGHCIPLDPAYLTWKAREFNYHTQLIETSSIINDKMPEYVIERSNNLLNKQFKSINGSFILVLGVAYKNDIDDYRESPALKVIDLFKNFGANVEWYDPLIKEYKYNGVKSKGLEILTDNTISNADLIVITTAHTVFDYERIQKHAKSIFDTRNAMKQLESRHNIEVI